MAALPEAAASRLPISITATKSSSTPGNFAEGMLNAMRVAAEAHVGALPIDLRQSIPGQGLDAWDSVGEPTALASIDAMRAWAARRMDDIVVPFV